MLLFLMFEFLIVFKKNSSLVVNYVSPRGGSNVYSNRQDKEYQLRSYV